MEEEGVQVTVSNKDGVRGPDSQRPDIPLLDLDKVTPTIEKEGKQFGWKRLQTQALNTKDMSDLVTKLKLMDKLDRETEEILGIIQLQDIIQCKPAYTPG